VYQHNKEKDIIYHATHIPSYLRRGDEGITSLLQQSLWTKSTGKKTLFFILYPIFGYHVKKKQ